MVGETVLGRFKLLERLGAGGFGTVYRAWDERLQREVAVKVLEARGEARRRVLREAQAVARLNHRGIVTLYELGTERSRSYLVSELVEGLTLREAARSGALSDRDVAEIGAELCDALQHAHAQGVVHRDIKPQNVVVPNGDGLARPARAKLMDFGTASLAEGPSLTASGEVVGTIAYMSPEQAAGARAGPASDSYSLALTLYECWTGRNPVVRDSPAATVRAIGTPPPSLRDALPALPPALCEAIDACLAPEIELRPEPPELRDCLRDAAPALDDRSAVPRPESGSDGDAPVLGAVVARLAPVAAIALLVALLVAAGRPGAALVAGALVAPAPLLLPRAWQWAVPALAPLLGAVGLAPLYPALAGLAATPGRRAALAGLGWAWLAAAEAASDSRLLFGTLDPAPAGWTHSAGEALSGLLAPLLAPGALLVAIAWCAAAILFGAVTRGRMVALELLGALLWGAGVLAAHQALGAGDAEPSTAPIAVGLAVIVLAALWLRSTGRLHHLDAGGAPPLA